MTRGYLARRGYDTLRQGKPRDIITTGIEAVVRRFGTEASFRRWYDRRQRRMERLYGPIPHALTLRWVDPVAVRRVSETRPEEKWRDAGTIVGGDWDRGGMPFEETVYYRGLHERFVAGRDWESTAFYRQVAADIADGKAPWGCRSLGAFDDRCEAIDALYASIAEHGYRTKREILANPDPYPVTDGFTLTHTSPLARVDEVAVDVARDGTLLFVDGRHRLAIARILGIPEIPVRIVKRHLAWQRRRLDPAASPTHPDMPRTR